VNDTAHRRRWHRLPWVLPIPPRGGTHGPQRSAGRGARALGSIGLLIAFVVVAVVGFEFMRDDRANRIAVVLVALIIGVGGIWVLFWGANSLVDQLPTRIAERVRPYVFIGPALVFLAVYLVYPAINTILLSFQGPRGTEFRGLDNYRFIFTERAGLLAIRNSVLWVIVVPIAAVAIGLAFAVLADRLHRRPEAVAKSLIFLPMAISFVGASIVWRFVYNFRPEGFGEQTGLLNGIWTALGNDPVAWLLSEPWNNLLLMVIMIWLYTGFAMVVLSSAIKSIPDEVIDAARVDGATPWQTFWRIVLPMIASSVVVVLSTIVIIVWKVFDIVFVMTGGQFGTTIIAERMMTEFFTFRNQGRGAAFAVVLFIFVIPLMVANIRRFRAQEEIREA
jgi:alpha-glucoside transport system permease protein